jgi:uncharacterized protein
MPLYVAELWRFPVKSLAGEQLTEAEITSNGVRGDRLVAVRGPEGIRTSRRQYRLLGLHGTLGSAGKALIDGAPWTTPATLERVQDAAGDDAWLQETDDSGRFDVLPLLVATDGAIAAFGRDGRRLRPNIVIGGVEGLAERSWPGGVLRIGGAEIALDSLRARCPMTTVDPDTLERDPGVLKDIYRRFNGELALNAAVRRPGVIRVGDPVRLIRG